MDQIQLPRYTKHDEECFYWLAEFCKYGMALSKAEILAFGQCDRHDVGVALKNGCDPCVAFEIFAPL